MCCYVDVIGLLCWLVSVFCFVLRILLVSVGLLLVIVWDSMSVLIIWLKIVSVL